MDTSHWLVLLNAAVMFYSLGTIWFAQIVVYPQFEKVAAAEYVDYHRYYAHRIPLPVIAPGFASFLLPMLLVFVPPLTVPPWLVMLNGLCGLVGLLITLMLEMPRHHELADHGKQDRVIRELIGFNWPRTLSISGSAVLSALMLLTAFGPV